MAGIAHHTRNFILRGSIKLPSLQIVRTGVFYAARLEKKEYYNADRLEDGTSVQAVLDSMAARGFCRPTRPYTPPEDLDERLMALFKKHLPNEDLSDLGKVALNQPTKVKLLADCVREFDHDIPNSELKELRNLRQVANFFAVKVDGLNPYERLVAQRDKLPDNLHVIPEGIRFHPDTDTMFKGVTAYPGQDVKVTGLRTRKKYVSWKMDKEWPYEIHTAPLAK